MSGVGTFDVGSDVNSMQCELVEDAASFLKLRDEWNELLRSSAVDCPFLTWEWVYTWWKHLGNRKSLHVLTVRSGAVLVAIAPLVVARGVAGCFSRLEFIGTGEAGSDYLDFIVRSGSEADALTALAQYFQAQGHSLYLDHLRTPESFGERLTQQLATDRWAVSSRGLGDCPYISLEGHSWESFLATLGSSHRYNVRRRLKTLGAAFEMRFELVSSENERHEALATLIALHNQRWDERGGSTAFQGSTLHAFHDEITQLALACGWLRMYVLKLNGTPAAIQYLFGYNGRFYYYQHGFDSQHNRHSIGLVSLGLAMRAAIEEGATEFDLLWGDESYKALWARQSRSLLRVELFPPDVAGVIQRRTMEANRAVRSFGRRVLSTVGSSSRDK